MSIKVVSSFPDEPLISCVFYKILFPGSLNISYLTLSVATWQETAISSFKTTKKCHRSDPSRETGGWKNFVYVPWYWNFQNFGNLSKKQVNEV